MQGQYWRMQVPPGVGEKASAAKTQRRRLPFDGRNIFFAWLGAASLAIWARRCAGSLGCVQRRPFRPGPAGRSRGEPHQVATRPGCLAPAPENVSKRDALSVIDAQPPISRCMQRPRHGNTGLSPHSAWRCCQWQCHVAVRSARRI